MAADMGFDDIEDVAREEGLSYQAKSSADMDYVQAQRCTSPFSHFVLE